MSNEGNGTNAKLENLEKNNDAIWNRIDQINKEGTTYSQLRAVELTTVKDTQDKMLIAYNQTQQDIGEIKVKIAPVRIWERAFWILFTAAVGFLFYTLRG